MLFRSYCICLYDAALWTNFKAGMLNKLRSCYNKCIKFLFGYSRRDSVTSILFNLGLPSFDTLMKNASVSYSRLHNCCSNRLVVHMCLSYLCFDSYHCCTAYHSEFSVCVFFTSIRFLNVFFLSLFCMFVCLSCFMGLAA